MEEAHCTYIDPVTRAECRFLGATLTTLAYAQGVGADPDEGSGVYWFAYLCDDHLARARASGRVEASIHNDERRSAPMQTTEQLNRPEPRGQMPDPNTPAEVPPQDPRQDGVPSQDPQEEGQEDGLPADDPDGEEVGAEAPLA